MFPYTEKYTESESDIQNNNLFYKIGQQCQNTLELLEKFGKIESVRTNQKLEFLMYKFHNSYFVSVVFFVILGFFFILYI